MIDQLRSWIGWLWTYLWAAWFLLVIFLLYLLRGPLRITETLSSAHEFLNSLTPKFYVALTGTSSLISGLILIFEWWYYKKYGTSFIEQISINHISPLIGGGDSDSEDANQNANVANIPEHKHWRNTMNLFRGSEYRKFEEKYKLEPLTYYDMNLSATDHQSFFTCTEDSNLAGYDVMLDAWTERDEKKRIETAQTALDRNGDCATALILLAEEKCATIAEVEKHLKRAHVCAEKNLKKSQQLADGQLHQYRRDLQVTCYIKRRLAMCYRRLGRIREAVRLLRELMKELQMSQMYHVHENLMEALLELQQYADVQAVLAKFDDINLPKSATIVYTAALLKARTVANKAAQPDAPTRKEMNQLEMQAIDAIHRAVEFNPHVPKYLLELKPVTLPPEHVLKRGDSEAVAYAFFHLQHWKRIDGALDLLQCTWEGTFRMIPYPLEKGHLFFPYPSCTESADRDLLPAFHELSVYPHKDTPFFIMFTAALFLVTALLALLTHQYPDRMADLAKTFSHFLFVWLYNPALFLLEKMEILLPSNIVAYLMK